MRVISFRTLHHLQEDIERITERGPDYGPGPGSVYGRPRPAGFVVVVVSVVGGSFRIVIGGR